MAETKVKPIYVFHGTDAFLLDRYRAELMRAVLGDADPQTCASRLDSSAELSVVLDDLRTLPFLGPRRLVIIEDADEFVSTHRKKLEKYLKSPASTGTLILIVKSWKSSTNLAKLVVQIGMMLDCGAPKPGRAPGFIRNQARKLGRAIDAAAVRLLAEWIGEDRASLCNELEKLSLYTEGRTNITVEDVSAVVVATAGVNPFALTDAITAGDAKVALTALDGMLTQRGEEFRTLGMIAWHLRRVLKAKQMKLKGRPDQEILRTVKVFSRGMDPFRRLLARRSLSRLCDDFRRLIRADLAMKTGADARLSLQELVVALC